MHSPSPHSSNPSSPRTTPQPPPPPPPNPLKRKTPPSEDEGRSFTPPEDGPSVPKGEYETGQVICEVCGVGVSFRDEATGGFTLKHWNDHRVSCVAPSPTATAGDPATHSPDVPADAMNISHPQHPPAKRRRAKRTEEERIEYLRADPYVAQFEAYRVLCASCDKWIRLRPNSTYCSIPWDAHRKSCLAKKINSKNVYALEERNTLFSKDPDVRKFDAERVLCNMCDQWLALNPEDHLHAVQTWLQHRSTCQKAATTLRASLHAAGQPSPSGSTSSPTTAALPPTAGSSHAHTHAAPRTTSTSTSTSTSPPILSLSLSSLRSPSFHDLNPANYAPAHESRRRNAEQRAATLRADNLIGEVEPNRVFCSLCQKWVQLRQDSSYCAYPWLQHRGKCLARHQRRAQKAAEIAEAKARKLGHSHSHPHSHPHTPSHSNSHPHTTSTSTSTSHPQHPASHPQDAMSVSSSASSPSSSDHDDAESEEGVDPDPDPDVDREPQVKREPVDERRGERRHDQDRRVHPQQYHSHSHSHQHQHQHQHRQVQEQQSQHQLQSQPQPLQRQGQGQVHGQQQQQQQQQRPHSSSSSSWHHSHHPAHPHHVSQSHREQYPHSHHHHHHKSRSGGPTTGVYAQHLQHTGPSSASASASASSFHPHHGHGQGHGQGNGHGHTHRPPSSSFRGPPPPPPPASTSASAHVPQARVIRAWNAGVRVGGDDDAGGDGDEREGHDRRGGGGGHEGGEGEREGEGEGEGEEDAEGSPYIEDDTERHAHAPANGRKRVMMVATAAMGRRALADLDSVAGRRQFIHASITHLFGTTYEATDEMRVAALLGYLNAAAPPDKHEDFDTAEVVRALAVLQERGRVRLEGDLVKIVV